MFLVRQVAAGRGECDRAHIRRLPRRVSRCLDRDSASTSRRTRCPMQDAVGDLSPLIFYHDAELYL